jgi:hypothetical protein
MRITYRALLSVGKAIRMAKGQMIQYEPFWNLMEHESICPPMIDSLPMLQQPDKLLIFVKKNPHPMQPREEVWHLVFESTTDEAQDK